MAEGSGYGSVSLFDVEFSKTGEPPFELPTARYLSEALLGMYGAPEAGDKSSQAEVSPNWRRLKKALASDAMRDVCTALAWMCMGVVLGIVSDDVSTEMREQLSRNWFLFTAAVGPKGRDWVLDAVPSVLVQAIYRLIVDAFPPEHAQLAKHAETMLDKLGAIVFHEVAGFQMTTQTMRELRRKLFRRPVLEHPELNLLKARQAAIRQQKLDGQKASNAPLAFGSIEHGQSLEEMQLEHVMELRAAGSCGSSNEAWRRSLPPLCPPDLSVDRYDALDSDAEELFLKHISAMNPEAAALMEAEALALEAEKARQEAADEAVPDSPASCSSPASRASMLFRSSTMRGSAAKRRTTVVERERRDKILAGRINAPLPEFVGKKQLVTSGVSPLLKRVAPGVQAQKPSNDHKLRMIPPSEKFLPKLTSPTNKSDPRSPSTSSDQQQPQQHSSPGAASSSSTAGFRRRSLSEVAFANMMAARVHNKGLPKITERHGEVLLEQPPLRLPSQIVTSRLDKHREAISKQSFDKNKLDYDVFTGNKKTRLDGNRLREQETAFNGRMHTLLGSRSAPALKRLGVERRNPPSGRSGGGCGAAAATGGSGRGHSVATRSGIDTANSLLTTGGLGSDIAGGGGRPPWNELTSMEGWRPAQ